VASESTSPAATETDSPPIPDSDWRTVCVDSGIRVGEIGAVDDDRDLRVCGD